MDLLVWACMPIPATPCELCKSVHAYGTLGLQLDNGNLLSFEYAFSSLTLTCSYSLVYLTRWWSGYGLLMWVFWGMCSLFLPIVLKVYTNVMAKNFVPVTPRWSHIIKNVQPHKPQKAIEQDHSPHKRRCACRLTYGGALGSSGSLNDLQVAAEDHTTNDLSK